MASSHALGSAEQRLGTAETASAPAANHAQVRDALQAAIACGEHPIGSRLPTEAELCARFGAGRHSVRKALQHLADLGLVERRQGAGTTVVAASPQVAYLHSVRSLSELWSYTRATRLIVEGSAVVALAADEAALVGAPEGSRWLRVLATRWTADRAEKVCHLRLFAHSRFAGMLRDLGAETEPVYALIEARSGERVAEAVQEISARPMPSDAAAILGAKNGAPALQIVRRYLDESGSPMLVAISLHPGETFTHSLRLKRDEGRV